MLIDTASWPSWDSGVDAVEGTPALGEKIVIRSKAAPGRAFPVKVATLDAPRKLVFTGGMPKSMPDLAPSFRQFADGLKARVESRG